MSNSSSRGTALITGASRDYDFNLSKLERAIDKPITEAEVVALRKDVRRRSLISEALSILHQSHTEASEENDPAFRKK